LVIYKADLVLAQVTNWDAAVDRDRTPIARLTRYFQDAAEELSVPVEGDQPYNHPALPFKVILHSTADGGLDDWATSGGHLTAVVAAEVIRDYGLDRWHVLVQGADPEPVAETVSEEFGDAVRVDVEDGTVFRCDGASVAVGPWRRRPGPRPGADYLASFTDPVVDVEISGEDGQTIFNRLLYVFDEHVRAMSADWRVGYY
jgi:hypothetical protein